MEQEVKLAELKAKLKNVIKRSVYVYRVDCGGCNGCEIEIFATISPVYDPERLGFKVVASPRHADILLFTGPMTRAMRLPAIRAYQAAPDPKIVVAYGTCGCSGGIFHDCYSVWGGTGSIFPVDVYIPGCPPTPGATIYGLGLALDLLQQKMKGKQYTEKEVARITPQYAGVSPDLARDIEREARRLSGYLHGRRITEKYLQFVREDPLAVDQKIKELVKQEKDSRLAEVYLSLHKIYLDYLGKTEKAGHHAG
ncbi:Formate hydrogenlyase subunit 7 [Moorella thermoacetica]|uniref:Formate hydrogenlyase subunit 7 n=1 Tax=Neomoorella thermoacetica TaxID=1525 RepID=A0A1D7XE06_NEOTH|nr:NADH-quinone oxidoreductase subunit B family protein [Moorella thermoacetica]AOQ25167.1 Formate hydrogenlyase subunit 7 [Moorella thermoacetica]OIQ09153.1 formate hydrogenlyase subunit 7 [Moorella thermoacetica]TYL15302.1 Formate hydrogenlyase subunit 7 [Moorella thermoacetica]